MGELNKEIETHEYSVHFIEKPMLDGQGILKSGQGIINGIAVLAVDIVTNKFVKYDSGGINGANVIHTVYTGIDDVDATSTDAPIPILRGGAVINQAKITGIDPAVDLEEVRALEKLGIYLEEVIE